MTTHDQTTEEIEVQVEEVADLKVAPAPVRPPAAQVEDHDIAHLPYRNWCDPCVEGRALGEQRGRHAGRVHEIPRVGIDYWYITSGTVKARRELADKYPMTAEGNAALTEARKKKEVMKCLILRCHESKAVFAHSIPVKGDDEDHYVADLIATDVAFMGHVKLLLKSDNEPALQALVTRIIEIAKIELKDLEKLSREEPAKYDSQSNGATEIGVKSICWRKFI